MLDRSSRILQPVTALYDRYVRALANEPLPSALVDLDAVETNIERLVEPVRTAGKKLLMAVKRLTVGAFGVARDAAGNTGIATKSGTLRR